MDLLRPKWKEYSLSNGLQVAIERTATHTIYGILLVHHGAVHERESEEGLAHLVEHCLLTGGSEHYSVDESERIRSLFGYWNAHTGSAVVSAEVESLPEDTVQCLSFLADTMFYPTIDEVKLQQEKARVLCEIADTKSKPDFKENRLLREVLYRGFPQGRTNYGKEEVVRAATPDKILHFHQRGFHPNNALLVLVGNLPENIEEVVEQNFQSVLPGGGTRFLFPEVLPLSQQFILHTAAPDLYNSDHQEESSCEIRLSFIVPSERHPDMPLLNIISYLLGGDSHSLLFQKISQNKGLAYGIKATYDGGLNAGEFGLSTYAKAAEKDEVVEDIFECFNLLQNQRVTSLDLERSKKRLSFDIAKMKDSNKRRANSIIYTINEGVHLEEYCKRVQEATADDVMTAAQKYLPGRDGNYALLMRDPLKK